MGMGFGNGMPQGQFGEYRVPIYDMKGIPTGQYTIMRGNVPTTPPPKSMTNEMLERARMASQNVNVPSIADLFPLMMQNIQPMPMMQGQGQGQGQMPMQSSGAGRFLSTSDTAPNLNFGVNTVT
ncbi:MAG TPA: hypothetical protein VIC51_15350 [Psychromonas sp.]